MSELINRFSWSISAARDFAECPRRRYWSKYAMWNGWRSDASDISRKAYALSKMDNRWTLLGNAVERAALWMIRAAQSGESPTTDRAYAESARPFLNKRWLESRKQMWKTNPKMFCCLHEHYYPDHHDTSEKDMIEQVTGHVRTCISNFADKVLPEITGIMPDNEIPIASPGRGDPESLELEGIKVYAIPDYVYRKDDLVHIHDWKSGRPKPFHGDQIALYGVWANIKHGVEMGKIHAHLEYLLSGETKSAVLTEVNAEHVRETVSRSAGDMAAYLVDGDICGNQPVSVECWDMTIDQDVCRRCSFYELCEPEMKE